MNHNTILPLALYQANQNLCQQTIALVQKSQQTWYELGTQPLAVPPMQQTFDNQSALVLGLYEALLAWQVQTTKALFETVSVTSPALYWVTASTQGAQGKAKKGD
jgi:hypothetical protein